LFGLIFSGPGNGAGTISVVVVDEDRTPASQAFAGRLAKADALNVTVASRADAASLVRRGERQAFVLIPAGFGERSERLFYGPAREVQLGIDPSRKAESAMLEGILMQQAADDMQNTLNDRARSQKLAENALAELRRSPDAAAAPETEKFLTELRNFLTSDAASPSQDAPESGMNWQPLAVTSQAVQQQREGPTSAFAVTLPQGAVWGLIGCAAAFAVGFVSERTRGTLVRLQVSPLSRTQLLAGKALACFAGSVSVVGLVFVLGALALGVRAGSPPLLVAAIVCSSVAFVGIMMLLSVLGRTEEAVSGSAWAALLLMSMIGGGMVPLFAMPGWMSAAGSISPVKWAILAMEGAVWRGFSPAEMMLPCGILLTVGLVCFAIGAKRGV
jgi:ABC-2 type transport system permease protein